MSKLDRDLIQLNRSGFPFQIAVANSIEATSSSHGWRVHATEYPWAEGYVDIVAIRGGLVMLIECKRVLDETWLFPVTNRRSKDTAMCRLEWWNSAVAKPLAIPGRQWSQMFCNDFSCFPTSPESQFCIMSKKKAARTLEPIASQLVAAAHSIGNAQRKHEADFEVFIPVVVTNAEIRSIEFSAGDDVLQAGEVPNGQAEDHGFVRFRKSLVKRPSNMYTTGDERLRSVAEDRERTVFIASPSSLIEHLAEIDPSDNRAGIPPQLTRPPALPEGERSV